MFLGDNVLLEGVTRFVEEFERNRPDAQILLTRVTEPEHFGVAVLEGERVVRLVEKPKEFVSATSRSWVSTCSTTRSWRRAACLEPSWRGEYEITEAIQWLVDHGKTVRAEMVDGWWKDTGKPDDLLEANRMMLSVRAVTDRRRRRRRHHRRGDVVVVARARRSRPASLRGPVVIGPGRHRGVVHRSAPTSRSSATAASCAARWRTPS